MVNVCCQDTVDEVEYGALDWRSRQSVWGVGQGRELGAGRPSPTAGCWFPFSLPSSPSLCLLGILVSLS